MARRHAFLIAVIALVLMAAVPMIVSAQFTPEVFAVDQDVVDDTVNITRATVNSDGWVAVHADADGEAGDVIGYAALMDGVNANVKVEIDPAEATDTLYAALYVDEGTAGEFEAPDPDVPVEVDGEPVIGPFQVTGTADTVIGTARKAGGFGTLLDAVDAAGLTKTLQGAGPFTVFAPTDDAFAALPEGTLDNLLEDLDSLGQILSYHVLPERVAAADIADGAEATTVQGDPVTFGVGDGVTVNGASVSAADIETSNGIIHVIDSVILPPALAEALGLGGEEAAPAEEEEAPEAPAGIVVVGQDSDGTTVTVSSVEAPADGWVSIRTNDSFAPGDVLGVAPVPAGVSEEIEVTLDEPLAESQMLFASLHVDDGEMGVFEYPDADPVATFQQSPVNVPFNVSLGEAEAAAAEEEEEEPEAPAGISASFQETDGATIVLDSVEAPADGWVAIRADDGFTPGDVLGVAPVPAGVSENVEVTLDEPLAEGQLVHASLHVDDGETGVFEYPDADPVAMFQQSPVTTPFNVALAAAAAAAEEAEAEMTPEPTEEAAEEAEAEMTPEPTEEAAQEAEAEMTPEPTEEATQEAEAEMTPAPTEEATQEAEAEMTPEPTEEAAQEAECLSIVDTAVAGGFNTLVEAVQAAGLADTLAGEGPFTVFAPTDDAFAALPEGTLDGLLENPEGALKEVLLYHVVADKLMADDIAKIGSSVTAQGQSITITVDGDSVMINDANVTTADIEACNGVVHVIDKVIVPALAPAEAEMTPAPTEEATQEAEAEMTPEPTEEAAQEAEAEMTPEPTEEAAEEGAPDELPETGMSLSAGTATIPTVLLVTLALGAVAYATRRREE